MHARTPAGASLARARPVGQIMFTPMAAALFLIGGVATYVAPLWNPPLYIAGSAVMLIGALVSQRMGSLSARLRWRKPIRPRKPAVVASILVVSFCGGYLF